MLAAGQAEQHSGAGGWPHFAWALGQTSVTIHCVGQAKVVELQAALATLKTLREAAEPLTFCLIA